MFRRRLLQGIAGLLLMGHHAWAARPLPLRQQLRPFRAVYINDSRINNAISGSVHQELKQMPDGRWQLTSQAESVLASLFEQSRFVLKEHMLHPYHYEYRRRMLTSKHSLIINFNWLKKILTTHVDDKPWQMELPEGTQDRISYQLQLRLDLMAGKQAMEYKIADGGLLKTYRFKVAGRSRVVTDAGNFNALEVVRLHEDSKRETRIWFSPELNYLIVKLQDVRSDGKHYGLKLKKVDYLDRDNTDAAGL